MALEELKAGDEDARPQLESARQNFMDMRASIDAELLKLFTVYDESDAQSETAKQALHEIRGVLNRRRYIENLIRDVDRALAPSNAETMENRL